MHLLLCTSDHSGQYFVILIVANESELSQLEPLKTRKSLKNKQIFLQQQQL